MPLEVMLSQQADNELKKQVYTIIMEAIENARRDSDLDKPFLKKGATAKWLEVDPKTITKMVAEGLPCHYTAGVQLFNKREVEQFILDHKL
ncbi:hypothetical protein NE293_10615 [Latilactobacillus curvatus]|uniref:hypothetical protein n=1 Tax=Latilactobacillus curvatus TaxID=28038 RepID=UPI0011DCB5CB|nr:hypothetical protein [Latilactobacillus curvatus]MBZ1505469.1 hypothetical protein [Latilactobacillus curvatus]MCM6845095.1 hypothetical protein [Latilactobacillus curvatus]MCM6862040.1 hypothetical protein [Latilactobacillus curvatus]MCM6869463.1 hypothetical protein [Latilactobacillus curvatus]